MCSPIGYVREKNRDRFRKKIIDTLEFDEKKYIIFYIPIIYVILQDFARPDLASDLS
jgi:hypothetical protein